MIKTKLTLITVLILLLAAYVVALPIIDPKITQKLVEEKYVDVIVELKKTEIQLNSVFSNDTSQIQNLKNYHQESEKNSLKKLNFSDFKLKSQYDFFNGFSGKISQDGLNKLKNNDNVVRIIYDEPENLLRKESNKLIELEKTINLKTSIGKLNGEGQTICVLDSGIDYTHQDLGSCTQSQFLAGNCNKVIGGYDYYSNDANPMDTDGHGTNVAGIIAGDGSQNGVSPKARLVALRVCDGSCPVSAQMSALDWCINNASKYNISVISMSIGSDKFGDYCDPDGRTEQIKNARDLGISVVIASGNDGYTDGISKPACIPYAISVGSVYDYDGTYSSATCTDNNVQVDKISCFTNRDDILDLLAPGSRITTTDLGNSYDTVSGTSFATPYVSGLIALLKQAYGNVSVIQLKDTLKVTGKLINDSGFSNLYYPRINALAALEIDWPTYHHDNRRTGFTLLKGDLSSTKKGMNLVLTGGVTSDALARPSIADVDRNSRQEVVVSFAKTGSQTEGWITSVEKSKYLGRSVEKWTKDIHYPVSAAPSVGNIDSENNLEVVVGLKNGTLIVINPDGSKDPPIKWQYTVPAKYSAMYGGNIRGNLGFTAIDDIDVDGTNEIIFTDYQIGLPDWNGTLYVLEDNGATYTEKATINLVASNNGGAQGAVAIANLDSDDNPEIIVPGYYGIKVYDYNAGSLSLKCQNTQGKILGAPVIYDIDRDNQLCFMRMEL